MSACCPPWQQTISNCEPVADGACVPAGGEDISGDDGNDWGEWGRWGSGWGRKMKQIAPVCSNGNCYLCSGGAAAPILNGDSCSCSDGTECQLVSGSGLSPGDPGVGPGVVPLVGPIVGPIVGPVVGPVVGPIGTPGGGASKGDEDCPQRGPGESGSRCGGVDLIGYCEDECGSGDNACCVVVNGVPTPQCNC